MSEEIKDEKVYSFSRINGFALAEKGEGCFYNWFKTYIEGDRGENNYFGEYGTLFHETIEKLMKNELFEWDIKNELNSKMKQFEFKPPFLAMGKSYVDSIHRFFTDGSYSEIFSQYQVLESEEKKIFKVGDILVTGFPDLVANHKKYGLVIADYKTAKKYEGDKLEHNIMQLYLYSIPIKEKYGKYPDYLIYIYPREKGKKEFAYPFEVKKLEKTKQWVIDTVKKIESHGDWTPRCVNVDGTKDFFACNLCNHRNNCEHRNDYTKNNFVF
ncbi:PD-(D/E)XK nuclease family protein [Paenibacillus naphthalenovorans]|uniref:PD-(D/E)XK nuclease superfamily protein n=1 Tax=Paenibacillus naphthalenovorans TaxID=162209 RepID=A0A0U2UG20_9BACL|nr:PD-(D/E)XK nuclease family protein [Paenibacillus naphthalenovorans]ALS22124.1 PD-(D/E)XK nuclease superfamily protein [Paenibacillus naphthalenovorans]